MLENYLAYNRRITEPQARTVPPSDIVEISEEELIMLGTGIEVDVQFISEEDRVKLRELYK